MVNVTTMVIMIMSRVMMMIMVMTLDDVKMITVMINVMLAIMYRD